MYNLLHSYLMSRSKHLDLSLTKLVLILVLKEKNSIDLSIDLSSEVGLPSHFQVKETSSSHTSTCPLSIPLYLTIDISLLRYPSTSITIPQPSLSPLSLPLFHSFPLCLNPPSFIISPLPPQPNLHSSCY